MKKLVTSELLANADLDLNEGHSDEDEANAILDQMIAECRVEGPTHPYKKSRPPPAI